MIINLTKYEKAAALIMVVVLFVVSGCILYDKARPRPIKVMKMDGVPATGTSQGEKVVDINIAGEAELGRLPGIGKVIAGRIVSYRNEHGPFSSTGDITAVKGVGPKLFEKIRNDITAE